MVWLHLSGHSIKGTTGCCLAPGGLVKYVLRKPCQFCRSITALQSNLTLVSSDLNWMKRKLLTDDTKPYGFSLDFWDFFCADNSQDRE